MGRFQKHIFVCINERPKEHPKGCCFHKGSADIRDALKDELKKRGISTIVRANNAGCLDACEFGPTIVIYPEGVWYGGVKKEDIHDIIDTHILRGKIVERLLIKEEKYNSDAPIKPIQK
ncbi:MAG: (2Fe-2S) ferredoxin domain-containing protein [Bacteroidota bacterium]